MDHQDHATANNCLPKSDRMNFLVKPIPKAISIFTAVFFVIALQMPVAFSQDVTELNAANFETKLAATGLPSVVFFTSKGCPQCIVLSEKMEGLAQEYNGFVTFFRFDAEIPGNKSILQDFNIQYLPAFLLLDNNKLKEIITFCPDTQSDYLESQINLNFFNNLFSKDTIHWLGHAQNVSLGFSSYFDVKLYKANNNKPGMIGDFDKKSVFGHFELTGENVYNPQCTPCLQFIGDLAVEKDDLGFKKKTKTIILLNLCQYSSRMRGVFQIGGSSNKNGELSGTIQFFNTKTL